jgi:hypothetical protein
MTTAKGAPASDALNRALLELATKRLRTHCSDPESHHLWLSEDAADRRIATTLCIGCPVIIECGTAATARRERFGVWGRSRSNKRVQKPGVFLGGAEMTSESANQIPPPKGGDCVGGQVLILNSWFKPSITR